MSEKRILAADIGGTNSRFGVFELGMEGELSLRDTLWLETESAASFEGLIKQLNESNLPLKPSGADICALAVAGPIERGGLYSDPPLIPWDIDLERGVGETGMDNAFLLNDFVAQAYACRSPIGRSARKVLEGDVEEGATLGVLGAGTGLGKAALVPDGMGAYVAIASEGGHVNLPVVDELEMAFMDYVKKRTGQTYVTYNAVVSGAGMSMMHGFLTGGEEPGREELIRVLESGGDTLELASRLYGRVARNFALEVLALGGLYVAGGMAARVPALLEAPAFGAEFRSSDTLGRLLERIPVFLIEDQQSGLWGAAFAAEQALIRKGREGDGADY